MEQLHDAHVRDYDEFLWFGRDILAYRSRPEFGAAFIESDLNDKPIDWGYWMHQMPSLTAAQAARLMSGLDPDLFASLDNRPNSNDPGPACAGARNLERLALAQGMVSGPPASWLEWADRQQQPDDAKPEGRPLPVHPLFRIEVEKLKTRAGQRGSQAEAPAVGASGAAAWTVTTPQRYYGYSIPLHRFLTSAHREGKPRPSARDAVEAWRENMPAEIAQVLPDGIDYYDAKGNTKAANLEAIRKTIERMTSGR